MSDFEEPAAKVARVDESMEELDEGQEEWLSEGVLTDDDFHPAGDSESTGVVIQDESVLKTEDLEESMNDNIATIESHESEPKSYNIEEALDDMEKTDDNEDDLPGDLGTFLVRRADGRILETRDDSELDQSIKHSDDDGHDTDELLRVLGDDDQKKKKGALMVSEKMDRHQSSDEDDYYEGPKATRLKMAKKAILKKIPTKAVPEGLSDEENISSEEVKHVKTLMVKRRGNYAAKSTSKSSSSARGKRTASEPGDESSRYRAKPLQREPKKTATVRSRREEELEEITNGEEFLEEDAFEMDLFRQELESQSEMKKQPIMSPEQMDEEFPSDAESGSEVDSLYDELPSSDSEDLNDWFTLDIRSERAGDYLPLLGVKAHEVLAEERERVRSRLSSLRQSLAALGEGSRAQAALLRRAALTAAELDASIKAA